MESFKKTARITGILYLVIIIAAGFAEGVVRSGIIVSGDATATANNILASESFFRLGFVSDLVAFLCDLAVSILLYVLLKPVNKTLSLIAAALRLLAHPAIATINLINHFMPLLLLNNNSYLQVFEPAQLQTLVLLFLEAHNVGYLIAGAFFGVHLLLLGYLIFKSELFPEIIGVLLVISSLGYIVDSFGNFLFPGNEIILGWIVGVSAAVGEVSFTLWLLIKGVKTNKIQ